MKNKITTQLSKLIFVAVALAASTFATAGVLTITDTTTGGLTWNRPLGGTPPTSLSVIGTNVNYDATLFRVDANGSYKFQSNSPYDNFLFLYANSFNPVAQFTNVVIGNDDFPVIGVSGFTHNLLAGLDYIVVATGFNNLNHGAYTLTISSQSGTAFLPSEVPEPFSLALIGIGMAGIGAARRRNK